MHLSEPLKFLSIAAQRQGQLSTPGRNGTSKDFSSNATQRVAGTWPGTSFRRAPAIRSLRKEGQVKSLPMEIIERYRGCHLGLAVGDALGTTLEFQAPGSF